MGYDFHFGRGRKGSPATMRRWARQLGFGVTIVDQVTDEGDPHSPFSSSSIRQALRHGHVRRRAHELGYHWMVLGEVVKGDQRGRTIGFPTLNIVLDQGADPFRGIYAVRVRDAQIKGAIAWPGAGYFGDRPTFDTGRTFLEVYLIGFDGDLYGRHAAGGVRRSHPAGQALRLALRTRGPDARRLRRRRGPAGGRCQGQPACGLPAGAVAESGKHLGLSRAPKSIASSGAGAFARLTHRPHEVSVAAAWRASQWHSARISSTSRDGLRRRPGGGPVRSDVRRFGRRVPSGRARQRA